MNNIDKNYVLLVTYSLDVSQSVQVRCREVYIHLELYHTRVIDPLVARRCIKQQLSRDCGGNGLKTSPNFVLFNYVGITILEKTIKMWVQMSIHLQLIYLGYCLSDSRIS